MSTIHIKNNRRYFIMAVLALMLVSRGAFPADKDTVDKKAQAKIHFENGKSLVEKGEYEKAIIELKASYDLLSNPIVLYNIAVSYDELYKYAEAMKYYTRFIKEKDKTHKDLEKEVTKRIEELKKFLGFLKIDIDIAGAEVLIDQVLAGTTPLDPVPVETGEHLLEVRKTGYINLKKKFPIISGETTTLVLKMETEKTSQAVAQTSSAAPEKNPQEGKNKERKKLAPPIFWSMLGLTVAAGVVSIATGALAIKKNNEVGSYYSSETGLWEPLRDEGKKLALATDVMIGVTGAAAISTLVLFFFTDFKKGKEKRLSVLTLVGSQSVMVGFEKRF